jgi:uncharacterized membrane protein YraQ (UPF0718 family)
MATSCCGNKSRRIDYFFWACALITVSGYIMALQMHVLPLGDKAGVFVHTIYEFLNTIWPGFLIGMFFVALLGRIPKEMVMRILGRGDSIQGLFRATIAGVLFDLCSHGILMVAIKLYERGASIGQVMAFLIASPWNSLSLTVILYLLIGWQWTLLFIVLSVVIAFCSGLIFYQLQKHQLIPVNPHQVDIPSDYPLKRELCKLLSWRCLSFKNVVSFVKEGVLGSKIVVKWALFGVILTASIRTFADPEWFADYFGPTVAGLMLTLLVATIIEVCSEGSVPIASDIFHRASAPGNSFTFLMAGVSTDYTEIATLKESTRSWRLALLLPLVTLPQIMVIGWLLNTLQ